jgi:hypothetical protein
MSVDVSALAEIVRRFDVSATLKAFAAVIAPLLVVTYMGGILTFMSGVFELDLLNDEDRPFFVGFVAIALIASLLPLSFLVNDWLARRQSLRDFSAMTGAAIGAVGYAAIGLALGAFAFWVRQEEIKPFVGDERVTVLVIGGLLLLWLLVWLLNQSRRVRTVLWAFAVLAGITALSLAGRALWALIREVRADRGATATEDIANWIVYGVLAVLVIRWLVRAVRMRIVISSRRPRTLLLGDLNRGGFWVRVAFLVGLPSSLWRLRALREPSFWAFLAARPLVYAGALLLSAKVVERYGWTTAAALAAAVVVVGHAAFHLGKRLAAREIWRPEDSNDARAPILFLRSFEDDQLDFKRPAWQIIGRWIDLWSFRRNADEALIDESAQYGPVVALGRPGEAKAPFGALRHYSSHEGWQRVVTETAQRAQAIVIAAGSSPGVLWEYELLQREGLLNRTLLLFRPAPEEMTTNHDALAAFHSVTGAAPEARVSRDIQLVALLPGERGHTLLTARRATAAAYIVALRAHFQKCSADDLYDPVYDYARPLLRLEHAPLG